MTFNAAVDLAREIGHKSSQIAFVHAEPGTLSFNFRFVDPIEDVPGTTAVSVARVNLDGTVIYLAGPTGIGLTAVSKNRLEVRRRSASYDTWISTRR